MSQQCKGTTLRNERCKRKVRNGTLCYQHKKSTSKASVNKDKSPTLFCENCPICFEKFVESDTVMFKCNHGVCTDCFVELIKHSKKCPLCRAKYETVGDLPTKAFRAIRRSKYSAMNVSERNRLMRMAMKRSYVSSGILEILRQGLDIRESIMHLYDELSDEWEMLYSIQSC
uniref:Putative RING finger E3 ubiquitin ligase n=1 Tax=Pithovirus LCPAC404 TaxID=2506597 RepID=A0A481ZDQ7_9VIRU|nr:MAG: putative RING finger E3 ubiquitin ligase [Pithovirus LCPAC404]